MPADQELVLADLAALRIDGPAIVFLRPRKDIYDGALYSDSDRACFHESVARLSRMMPTGVMLVSVDHDLDIMAVGHAEIEKLGYVKVPTP